MDKVTPNPPLMPDWKFREMSDPDGEMVKADYVVVPCTDNHPPGQYCAGWTWVRRDFLPEADAASGNNLAENGGA